MKTRRTLLAVGSILLSGLFLPQNHLQADVPPPPRKQPTQKTVRLLNVGNSFSANATRHLSGLVKAAGQNLIHRQASIGGSSFQVHLDRAKLHETEPTNPKGTYGNKQGLKEILALEPWDIITIQQASIKSFDVTTYRPYAQELRDYIKKYAPNSEIVLHQTWAYRVDDPLFTTKNPKPGQPRSQEQMYEMLTAAYSTIAKDLNVRLIPTGFAFHLATSDQDWAFKPDTAFDPKTAVQPTLPPQKHALHVGWIWKKQKDGSTKLIMDGHHANMAGEYLGSCVFYEFLYQQSVVGNSYQPKGLTPEVVAYLQKVAHRAVQEFTPQSP